MSSQGYTFQSLDDLREVLEPHIVGALTAMMPSAGQSAQDEALATLHRAEVELAQAHLQCSPDGIYIGGMPTWIGDELEPFERDRLREHAALFSEVRQERVAALARARAEIER